MPWWYHDDGLCPTKRHNLAWCLQPFAKNIPKYKLKEVAAFRKIITKKIYNLTITSLRTRWDLKKYLRVIQTIYRINEWLFLWHFSFLLVSRLTSEQITMSLHDLGTNFFQHKHLNWVEQKSIHVILMQKWKSWILFRWIQIFN